MSPGPDPSLSDRADEERRYRAIRDVDPAAPGAAAVLLDALADASWRVRHAAAERMAQADPVRAVPLLVAALGVDSTPGRRNAAATALAQIGPAAVPALVAALDSSVPEFRTAAIEVLGEIRDRRALAALAGALDDEHVNARIAAAEALGKIGGDGSVVALHRTLEGRRDTPTARAVLHALAQLEAPPDVARLRLLARDPELLRPALRLAGFGHDPDTFDLLATGLTALSRSAREAALEGLGQQRLRGRVAAGGASEAIRAAVPGVAALAAALAVSAEDAAVRAGALTVLQYARIPGDVHAIAAAAVDDRVRHLVGDVLDAMGASYADELVDAVPALPPISQAVVLTALARWNDPRAFPLLVRALEGEDAPASGLAIEALGRFCDDRAVPHLIALLTSEDRVASVRALAALLELAGRAPALRAAVLHAARGRSVPDPSLLRLLAQIGDEADLPFLRDGLRSPHRATRGAAAHAAATMVLGDDARARALPELLDAVADEDPTVRANAAQALGVLARGHALPRAAELRQALAVALRDGEAAVRAAAVLALAECGATEYAASIAELARDPHLPAVLAVAAVRALCAMRRTDAATLVAAAGHDDPEVVKEVLLAAASVAGPETARLLLSATTHPRWDVRRTAVAVLATRREPPVIDALRKLAQSERDPLVLEAIDAALRAVEGRA